MGIDKKPHEHIYRKCKEFIASHVRGTQLVCVFLFCGFIALFLAFNAPEEFPTETLFTVEKGSTLTEVAEILEKEGYISHAFLPKIFVFLRGHQGSIHAGDYFFSRAEGSLVISNRLANGRFDIDAIKIVIPEGTTVSEMSEIFSSKLPRFEAESFIKKAEKFEGYLFPDTYNFLQNDTEDEIIELMRKTFDVKIAPILGAIESSGRSIEDVITMASLVEEEARETGTRRTIAGILWHRLDIGMALQVDAVFPYIINKNTFEVTLDDLDFDSPYNTYKYRGLPIGPISNPGLDAILATIHPIETEYLFYLSDVDGVMHYGRTFEEHKMNKSLYLK